MAPENHKGSKKQKRRTDEFASVNFIKIIPEKCREEFKSL
jgi:hypothetical protein